jgi:PIN domain nuclease of toxin-antitoxin system
LRLLLDTHVFIWWALDKQLSSELRAAIEDPDNEVAISVASAWEAEIKVQTGKLKLGRDVFAEVRTHDIDELPIEHEHAITAARLPLHHGDPFDRILIGQALVEGMTLVTRDSLFERYRVPLLRA